MITATQTETSNLKAAYVIWSGRDAPGNVNTNCSDANSWSGGTLALGNNITFLTGAP